MHDKLRIVAFDPGVNLGAVALDFDIHTGMFKVLNAMTLNLSRFVPSEDDDNEKVPVRIMVSVPKKKFKKAVVRNRIKRLIRETYRLNKSQLFYFAVENNLKLYVSFQYVSDEIMIFSEMHNKMQKALDKLIKTVSENAKITDKNG